MKKIKKKVWVIGLLLFILIAALIPLRKIYFTNKLAEQFYNEYYFTTLDSSSEESLENHFYRIEDDTIKIHSEDLMKIDDSFEKIITKVNQEEGILMIKVSKPYMDKKIKAKWN